MRSPGPWPASEILLPTHKAHWRRFILVRRAATDPSCLSWAPSAVGAFRWSCCGASLLQLQCRSRKQRRGPPPPPNTAFVYFIFTRNKTSLFLMAVCFSAWWQTRWSFFSSRHLLRIKQAFCWLDEPTWAEAASVIYDERSRWRCQPGQQMSWGPLWKTKSLRAAKVCHIRL